MKVKILILDLFKIFTNVSKKGIIILIQIVIYNNIKIKKEGINTVVNYPK